MAFPGQSLFDLHVTTVIQRTFGSGSGIEPSGQTHSNEPALFKHNAPWPHRFGFEHSSISRKKFAKVRQYSHNIGRERFVILNLWFSIKTFQFITYRHTGWLHCLKIQLGIDMRNLLVCLYKLHLNRIFQTVHDWCHIR